LLTVIPYSCYTPIAHAVVDKDCKVIYQNMDMSAIYVLLKFLDKKLECKTHLLENFSPIITALVRLIKSERIIRKYLRLQVKIL